MQIMPTEGSSLDGVLGCWGQLKGRKEGEFEDATATTDIHDRINKEKVGLCKQVTCQIEQCSNSIQIEQH